VVILLHDDVAHVQVHLGKLHRVVGYYSEDHPTVSFGVVNDYGDYIKEGPDPAPLVRTEPDRGSPA
jgi:hypothetical protein